MVVYFIHPTPHINTLQVPGYVFIMFQFANESLSMKLEDQLNENEDLRNKYVDRG